MDKLVILSLLISLSGFGFGEEQTAEGLAVSHSRDNLGNVEKFIAERKARFLINNHDMDIFGLMQDPQAQPAILPELMQKKVEREQARPKSIPLKKVLTAMDISMIIPSSQKFLVGSRVVRRGEVLPVTFGKHALALRVENVQSDGVVFRNMETGELAKKVMRSLPKGIQRGTRSGGLRSIMVKEGASEPLELNFVDDGFAPDDPRN